VEGGGEVEAVLQHLVTKSRLLDERVEAEAHGPLWKSLRAKVHVGFRDRDVSQCSDCYILATALFLKSFH
jgi:hypothetical protein